MQSLHLINTKSSPPPDSYRDRDRDRDQGERRSGFKLVSAKFILILFSIILYTLSSFAQTSNLDSAKPMHTLTAEDSLSSGLIVFDIRTIHFKKVKAPFISIASKSKVVHQLIYLNEASIIKKYSNIVIPTFNKEDVEYLYIKLTKSYGKRIDLELNTFDYVDSLKKSEKGLVIKGFDLEKGDLLEFKYKYKLAPEAYGSEVFQTDLPIKYAELQLKSNGIRFNTKLYNGAKVKELSSQLKNHIYSASMQDIPAFSEEFYAANEANKMRIEYVAKEINWKSISEVIVLNAYSKKKVIKKIRKTLNNDVKLFNYNSKEEKIRAIESYIKSNYEIVHEEGLSKVNKILVSKEANETGITYLFAAFFTAAEIEYEIVASCDRFYKKFDRDFPNPIQLDYFLFYFSDQKKFLVPYMQEYNYGSIPDFLIGQEGFSVAGSFSKGKGIHSNYRFVKLQSDIVNDGFVTEDVNVYFHKDEKPFISVMLDLSGYKALEFTSGYNSAKENERLKYAASFIPFNKEGVEPIKLLINGKADFLEEIPKHNVILYAELPADNFIGKSGDDFFVFHVGQLIGEQMELVEVEERSQDIELNYSVVYDRKITIHYDDLFTIKDLESLKIDLDHIPGDRNSRMGFRSFYKESNNKVEILINEGYEFLSIDKSAYPLFKATINAAAAFSKVDLIVEEK